MPKIEITTEINSTKEICFDLARSIDLHKISTAPTNAEAIDGRTKGLINLNETVTWQATHFGIKQKLTTKITAFDKPNYFVDEQTKGIFKSIYHLHSFEIVENKVLMKDVFEFATNTLEPLLSFRRMFSDNGVPISPGLTFNGPMDEPSEFNVVLCV